MSEPVLKFENRAGTESVFAKIVADFGMIDVLVNNAGVWSRREARFAKA